ncbi:MAG: c-type cytochrome domain-containing protein [Verrucomicrobiales bacterium]
MKTLTVLLAAIAAPAFHAQSVEFESDILPIFQAKCAKCHLDGNSKGSLSLDLDKIEREIGSSKAIVPGDLEKGELMELISLPEDDDDHMPPPGKGQPLSAAEIGKIKEWIMAGALVGDEEPEMEEKTEPTSGLTKRPDPIEGDWTNSEGKTISATLVRMDGDKPVLRVNGKDYPYEITSLSQADQAKVREFAEAWKKASGG